MKLSLFCTKAHLDDRILNPVTVIVQQHLFFCQKKKKKNNKFFS